MTCEIVRRESRYEEGWLGSRRSRLGAFGDAVANLFGQQLSCDSGIGDFLPEKSKPCGSEPAAQRPHLQTLKQYASAGADNNPDAQTGCRSNGSFDPEPIATV